LGNGSTIGDLPTELAEILGPMTKTDVPPYTKLRKLVSKGFTPCIVGQIDE
jgi:cytochrome P450